MRGGVSSADATFVAHRPRCRTRQEFTAPISASCRQCANYYYLRHLRRTHFALSACSTPTSPERRISKRTLRTLLRQHYAFNAAGSAVRLGTQPPAAAIGQHGVENHHRLHHPADRLQAAIAVVRKPDRLIKGLVVNVVEASSANGSGCDCSCESTGDQAGDEFATILAARRACERAVLAL